MLLNEELEARTPFSIHRIAWTATRIKDNNPETRGSVKSLPQELRSCLIDLMGLSIL